MIKIRDLHAYYGPIEALKGIDMVIEKGKITCLIGSNGVAPSPLTMTETSSPAFNGISSVILPKSISATWSAVIILHTSRPGSP